MRRLLLIGLAVFSIADSASAAQSLTLNGSSQYATRILTSSSPFTAVGSWRVEVRVSNIASGALYRITDNDFFYIQLDASTGVLRVFSWNGEITDSVLDASGFGGHLDDITIRVQRDVPNSRYTLEAWDSGSTTRFAAVTGAATSMSNRNFGNTVFYVGARSIEQNGSAGAHLNGRIAFFRWYSTLVDYSSATKPTLYANTADMLQYEFEGDLNDTSVNAQTLTGVGSPTFNTTGVINPIANAGIDVGGRIAGVTFALNASSSVAGDTGPITSYSWTRTSGSGSISSPSSASTNITGISSGQSTFQVEVSDGTNSATDSVDVGVVSVNANGTVNIGDAQIEMILGPLLPYNSAGSQVMPFYDFNQEDSYQVHANFPLRAPRRAASNVGTLGVTNGSAAVVGTSSLFTKQVTPDVPLAINGVQYTIASITDDTHLTLTTNYAGSTASGITDWHQDANDEVNNYQGYWMYYGSALTAYAAYYRTGLTKWQTTARMIADSWWSFDGIDYGANDPANFNSPRLMALDSLMLRAIDGKPEYWDWINRATDYTYRDVWVLPRLDYPGLYFGLRDGGYALRWAVLLSQILPNTYTLYGNGTLAASTGTETGGAALRAAWFTDAMDGAIKYYCRLQRADGSWRWNQDEWQFLGTTINASDTTVVLAADPGSAFRTAGDLKIDNEYLSYTGRSGATITGVTRGRYGTTATGHTSGAQVTDLAIGFFEQTFHVGVGVIAAFHDLMQVIKDNPTYQAEYNTMRNAIVLNAAEGMLMGYSTLPVGNAPSTNSRYMHYALHSWGDWGALHDGMPDAVPAWATIADLRDARQNVVTWIHTPAYAYYYTGVQWYKDQTDELLSANWGKTGYSGTIGVSDGVYGLQDFFSRTGTPHRSLKEYNEWHRYVGRAFAYRTLTPGALDAPIVAEGRDRILANGSSNPSFTARAVNPAGGSLTYQWTAAVGSMTLSGATTATVTVTSALTNNTFYSLRCAVTNEAGETTYGWVNFRTSGVDAEQTPPVANVDSQSVSVSGTTSSTALNASTSTASGGRTVHYRWLQTSGPATTISDPRIANPSLSGLTTGTYTFRVFVYDNLTRTVEEPGVDAVDVRVTVSGAGEPITTCKWSTSPRCATP